MKKEAEVWASKEQSHGRQRFKYPPNSPTQPLFNQSYGRLRHPYYDDVDYDDPMTFDNWMG